MLHLRALILCLPFVFGATLATAEGMQVGFGAIKADPTLPVEVTSDSLDVDQTTGSAEFLGNVVVGQGDMRLSAPRLVVIYKEGGGIERLEATGGVLLVSGEDAAEADRADYTIDDGIVVMTGNVLLTQGQNALTSQRMTINLVTGTAQMVGRVKTILQPDGN